MKSPYDILGVPRTATREQIKGAFRKLAREKHPDRQPDNPRAEDAFKELSAAYELLSDPEQRARFDRGEVDATGAPRARASAGAYARRRHGKNPFERFFHREDGPDGERGAPIKVNGTNVSYTLRVAFIEAARGITKRVSMTNLARLDVRIPPGTKNGTVLRLKGQGMAGLGGGKPGDALIEIIVEPHAFFQADGADIRTEIPVTLQEAVLGSRIDVPTVDGAVALTIPPNSNTGTVLRLKGKGLSNGDSGRGDHYVKLRVVLPPRPDKELSDFVASWGPKNVYDVRRDLLKID